ncbi:hypothetical protein FGO68_gene15854 [Halteria grandinella]|uniref:Uncharacterized protein n=1 Tax=Halteria grandinella TaxID=5974 RepID=A0A8J8T5R3_HALGN|nr:hypothetical protein FGO68_gene15854 [Halteria grandinella]
MPNSLNRLKNFPKKRTIDHPIILFLNLRQLVFALFHWSKIEVDCGIFIVSTKRFQGSWIFKHCLVGELSKGFENVEVQHQNQLHSGQQLE